MRRVTTTLLAGAAALDDREWSTKLDEDYIKRGR